jgi:GNAT superfamily N-acetyltransferase
MQLRPATQTDFNFIANSYLKSYRDAPGNQYLINQLYYDTFSQRLNYMIETGTVTVACSDEDAEQILGYLISGETHGKPIAHYVYVKRLFRQLGIAKALLEAAIPTWGTKMTLCTHTARHFNELRTKYKLVYTPEYASVK